MEAYPKLDVTQASLQVRSLRGGVLHNAHEICHHRPVNSWVTKPGARLSRAGVATRPPPPLSVFPLKDPGPRCQREAGFVTPLDLEARPMTTVSPKPSASELLDTHSAVRDRLANMVRRMAQANWRPNGRDARLVRMLAELNGIREGGR